MSSIPVIKLIPNDMISIRGHVTDLLGDGKLLVMVDHQELRIHHSYVHDVLAIDWKMGDRFECNKKGIAWDTGVIKSIEDGVAFCRTDSGKNRLIAVNRLRRI